MGIKYSREEIERRWLLNSQSLPNLTELEMWEVTDKYFEETRLRLRRMYSPKTRKEVYKLCKKYGKTSDISEPITNLYLTNAEHTLIDQIPGIELRKRKYEYPHYGVLFSVEEILGTIGDNLRILGESQVDLEGVKRRIEWLILPFLPSF